VSREVEHYSLTCDTKRSINYTNVSAKTA
jgi:hypothetical protein